MRTRSSQRWSCQPLLLVVSEGIDAPARSVLIWSYWHGEPTVAGVWRQIPEDRRDAFLQHLYGRMHSNETVGMFQ